MRGGVEEDTVRDGKQRLRAGGGEGQTTEEWKITVNVNGPTVDEVLRKANVNSVLRDDKQRMQQNRPRTQAADNSVCCGKEEKEYFYARSTDTNYVGYSRLITCVDTGQV